jgi:SAM-dependent methyltransferase
VVRLAEAGYFAGDVIDVGCGTGENAIFLAARGLTVVGIDGAPTAIASARRKAIERVGRVTFEVADALDLGPTGLTVDVALDCGLFHTFTDAERPVYARSLHGILRPGGRAALLCFSDEEPGDMGPRRVSQAEVRATFSSGWAVESIDAERFAARSSELGARAWLARLTRL